MQPAIVRDALGTQLRPDMEQLVKVATASFADDPHMKNLFGHSVSDQVYDRNRARGFGILISEWLRVPEKKVVITDESGMCFAIWSNGKPQYGIIDKIRNALRFIFAIGFKLAQRAGDYDDAIANKHPTEPHLYLDLMATAPEAQGKGIGSRVMRKMTQYLDENGIAAYTFSSNPQNVSFYKRHGFVIMEQPMTGLPEDATTLTSLWREPRTPESTN